MELKRNIVKKMAFFSTTGFLAMNSFGCAKSEDAEAVRSDMARIEKINFSTDEAISLTLEEEFGVNISDEAKEFLDSDSVSRALQNDMEESDYNQLTDLSVMYLSQRIKEDNPKYEDCNLSISYNGDSSMISLDKNLLKAEGAVDEYLNDFQEFVQGISSDDKNLDLYARDLALDMATLAVNDVHVQDAVLGNGAVYVKSR